MKLKSLLLITLFFTPFLAQSNGDEVGNGGGLAENNILFAFHNMTSFIKRCLNDSSICQVTEEENTVLEKILEAHPEEDASKIFFRKGSRHPGFFIRDGLPRVALTGSRVGSPIYIDSEQLYEWIPQENRFRTFSIPQAVTLLIHELGHHHNYVGQRSHSWLDQIGNKVSRAAIYRTQEYDLGPYRENIKVQSVNMSQKLQSGIYDHLNLTDSKESYYFLPQIKKMIRCPLYNGEVLRLHGLHIHQASWRNIATHNPYVHADISFYCLSTKREQLFRFFGDVIHISAHFFDEGGTLKIRKGSLTLNYLSCQQNPTQCRKRRATFDSWEGTTYEPQQGVWK